MLKNIFAIITCGRLKNILATIIMWEAEKHCKNNKVERTNLNKMSNNNPRNAEKF